MNGGHLLLFCLFFTYSKIHSLRRKPYSFSFIHSRLSLCWLSVIWIWPCKFCPSGSVCNTTTIISWLADQVFCLVRHLLWTTLCMFLIASLTFLSLVTLDSLLHSKDPHFYHYWLLLAQSYSVAQPSVRPERYPCRELLASARLSIALCHLDSKCSTSNTIIGYHAWKWYQNYESVINT